MRGSGSAPAATASRSDQAPAQQIAWPASVTPPAWRTRSEREAGLEAEHLAAERERAAGLAQVLGVGGGDRAESRRSRCRG